MKKATTANSCAPATARVLRKEAGSKQGEDLASY
jgi:hypothetical protein